jgi:hypothetical protein
MSPEQVKSTRDVDRRSDIWSLGIVLYELFQGTPPFVAETFGSMAIKVATEQLPPLSGQLPPGLADIVYRCLQKDPALRFQNIAELSYALAPYAQSTAKAQLSVERTSRVLGTEPPKSTSMLTAAPSPCRRPPTTSRRWPLIAAAAVVVVIAVVAIAVVTKGTTPTAPDPNAAASPEPPQPPPPVVTPDAAIATAPPVDAAAPPPIDATVIAAPTPDAAPEVVTTRTSPSRRNHRVTNHRNHRDPKSPQPPAGGLMMSSERGNDRRRESRRSREIDGSFASSGRTTTCARRPIGYGCWATSHGQETKPQQLRKRELDDATALVIAWGSAARARTVRAVDDSRVCGGTHSKVHRDVGCLDICKQGPIVATIAMKFRSASHPSARLASCRQARGRRESPGRRRPGTRSPTATPAASAPTVSRNEIVSHAARAARITVHDDDSSHAKWR